MAIPEAKPALSGDATSDGEPTLDGTSSPDGVDLTVIRWMLERTPTERLQAVQDLIDAAAALRTGDLSGDDPSDP